MISPISNPPYDLGAKNRILTVFLFFSPWGGSTGECFLFVCSFPLRELAGLPECCSLRPPFASFFVWDLSLLDCRVRSILLSSTAHFDFATMQNSRLQIVFPEIVGLALQFWGLALQFWVKRFGGKTVLGRKRRLWVFVYSNFNLTK